MKVAALVGAAGVVLALPVGAQAKSRTKVIDLGLPTKNIKSFQSVGADVNDFFPHGVTIRVGDKVKFVPTGFHTLDLPPRGAGPVALLKTNGQTVTGANDAAGAPFWFNGVVQNIGFNPVLADPTKGTFGKKFTYRGKTRIESGLPLAAKPKPITVKFAKKGSYTFYCDIHPGMKGVVRVKGKKAKVPSKKADAKALKNQLKRDLSVAKGLPATKAPGNTVDVGVAGPHGEEYFGFAPGNLQVPVGTTVRVRMTPGSRETHTATTGPGDP